MGVQGRAIKGEGTMKVRMKDSLISRYQRCKEFDYSDKNPISWPPNELIAVKEVCGYEDYFKLKDFLKSIDGKEVELVFTGDDAFEENDNNFWLPNDLWVSI